MNYPRVLFCPTLMLMSFFVQVSAQVKFTEVTAEAGLSFDEDRFILFAGAAAADFDSDGDFDLVITQNGMGPDLLYQNNGDGSFTEISEAAGIRHGRFSTTPFFFDYDGDGHLDLLIGTDDEGLLAIMYRNNGDGTFSDVTESTNLIPARRIFSPTVGDMNLDGHLDLYLGYHTDEGDGGVSHLWRNNGNGTFSDIGESAGILGFQDFDQEFAPAFTDLNLDGYPDLVIVADFGTSLVYMNNGDETFRNTTDRDVITDENGMGSSVGDYDNDGDLDWFVTSVYDPAQDPNRPWGLSTGNRLYQNQGDGSFVDVTEESGIRVGYWGWASVLYDFDNDGHQDYFHTNGFEPPFVPPFPIVFPEDPARLFMNDGDGTFTEQSEEAGLIDLSWGHGALSFDYDNDGDMDIFIANLKQPKLFRNDTENAGNWVQLDLRGLDENSRGIGALVHLIEGSHYQMREVSGQNNFMSQNPAMLHFGIDDSETVSFDVTWPRGGRTPLWNIPANSRMIVPELPLDYQDRSLAYRDYVTAVRDALATYVAKGLLTQEAADQFKFQALYSFLNFRFKR